MTQSATEPTGQPVRTVPWFGAMQAYKRQFEKLHPSIQMIGLQLWLPVAFVVLFVLCYINAFHSPTPHDAPVAVVGQHAAAQTEAGMAKAMPGAFKISEVESAAAASDDVRSGKLAAILDPTTSGGPTLTVASANGESNANFIEQIFKATAAGEHQTLQIKDLVPLPSSDAVGTVALYATLVPTIFGYMVGMFIGMMGGPLRRRTRLALIIGPSVIMSLVATVLIEYGVHALHGHFFQLWGIEAALMVTAGLVVNGLGYFFNRFVTGVALAIFIVLNLPSSGGAMAVDLVPEPFRALSHVVIGTGAIDLVHDVFYNAGPGSAQGWLRIGIYAAIGVLLTAVGPYYMRWRHRRRVLLGLPAGGMMAHAQGQLMAMARAAATQANEPEVAAEDASGRPEESEAVIDSAGDEVPEGAASRK